jgi:hypothetical protein
MPDWALFLTIIILSLGVALVGILVRAVWMFCEGAGLVEREPWED